MLQLRLFFCAWCHFQSTAVWRLILVVNFNQLKPDEQWTHLWGILLDWIIWGQKTTLSLGHPFRWQCTSKYTEGSFGPASLTRSGKPISSAEAFLCWFRTYGRKSALWTKQLPDSWPVLQETSVGLTEPQSVGHSNKFPSKLHQLCSSREPQFKVNKIPLCVCATFFDWQTLFRLLWTVQQQQTWSASYLYNMLI